MSETDLIRRQSAIDEVVAWLRDRMTDDKKGKPLTERLKELPSAQTEVITCKDCKFWQDNNGGYPNMNCRWIDDETPDADDFCSYAVRKEEQP